MVEGFIKDHKFRPTGRNKNGVSESDMPSSSKDTIKVKNETITLGRKGKDQLVGIDSGKNIHNTILIKNGIISPNHSVLEAIVSIWSDVPDDIKKIVKRIEIREIEGPAVGTWNEKEKILTLYLSKGDDEQKVEDTLSHEIAHADFQHMGENVKKDEKLKQRLTKYFDEMIMLPPITFYSKEYYDDWIKTEEILKKDKKYLTDPIYEEDRKKHPEVEKGMKKLEENVLVKATSYLNEEHSETAMYVASHNKNRESLGVIYEPVMKSAVKNFKELHKETD